jgi:metal-sulfur cluster biosynthetic enzyme
MALASSEGGAVRPGIEELREALRAVIDPEIGLDIIDLGLLYRLEYVGGALEADLTMTSPACPATTMMAAEVEEILRNALPPDTACRVRVVWEPPWDPARISPEGRERLGW